MRNSNEKLNNIYAVFTPNAKHLVPRSFITAGIVRYRLQNKDCFQASGRENFQWRFTLFASPLHEAASIRVFALIFYVIYSCKSLNSHLLSTQHYRSKSLILCRSRFPRKLNFFNSSKNPCEDLIDTYCLICPDIWNPPPAQCFLHHSCENKLFPQVIKSEKRLRIWCEPNIRYLKWSFGPHYTSHNTKHLLL